MRKERTFLRNLTITTILGITITLALNAAGNTISNVSLSFAEQIMAAKHDR